VKKQPSKHRPQRGWGVLERAALSGHPHKQWTFERLEERHLLSASGLLDFESLSSDTAAGLAEIWSREIAAARTHTSGGGEAALRSVPNDPYLQYQWHLQNTGQVDIGSPNFQPIYGTPGVDINVVPVWEQGITGAGVVIGIVDSGVEITHPDLAANIHPDLRFNPWDGPEGSDNVHLVLGGGIVVIDGEPVPLPGPRPHGTQVASLAAGVGGNSLGTTGVAYNAQIAPIWLNQNPDWPLSPLWRDEGEAISFVYEMDDIDIYNHSWGPPDGTRNVKGPGLLATEALRDSVFLGRGGLGNIHVWSSGNGAYDYGGAVVRGFAGYDGYVSSRYTIGVTGYDHDGLYANVDGTITNYPEGGPSVLVAAPTASFFQEIGLDTKIGSGIWTADFTGDYGDNTEPPLGGSEIDDYFPDTDYTSRFNGTSASAPIVSGVIALMLEANPYLGWRDVQEILVRSSEQIAQFEIPGTGAGNTGDDRYVGKNSWTINPAQLFRDQDIRMNGSGTGTRISHVLQEQSQKDPKWRVSGEPAATGLESRVFHAPPSPLLFANAAGYTVSHGRGVFGEDFGYGHGGVDAEMAVALAQKWTATGQTLLPEKTWTTFTQTETLEVAAAESLELGDPDRDTELGTMLVPGRLPGRDEFPDGFFGENREDSPLAELAVTGYSDGFLAVKVPDSQLMNVETLEVRLKITDGTDALNYTAINLVSPGGTHSQLNSFYDLAGDETGDETTDTLQQPSWPGVAPGEFGSEEGAEGEEDEKVEEGEEGEGDEGELNWTFATNRAWGERSDPAVILDPATGEPFLQDALLSKLEATQSGTALPQETGERTWELHLENFGSGLTVDEVEVIFHGNPLPPGSQRIQGSVGVDQNQDGDFNFDRYLQNTQLTVPELDLDQDHITNRQSEITRIGDVNQESFAGNVTVQLFPTGDSCGGIYQFTTGHDGNFYFDVVPGNYTLRVVDPLGRDPLAESGGLADTLPRFQQQWQITPEWFYAGQKEVEIFQAQDGMGTTGDFERIRTIDNGSGTPAAWTHPDLGTTLADHVRGINFLLDGGPLPPGSPQPEFGTGTSTGFVYADLAGNGQFDGFDVGVGSFTVFADLNNNGQYDPLGDPSAETLSDGTYQLEVPTDTGSINVGVVLPTGWTHTGACGPFQSVTINPSQPIIQVDFALMPPADSGTPGPAVPGRVFGAVFLDSNGNGVMDASETGAAGVSVYLDTNLNGDLDPGEAETITGANGAYSFDNVQPGTVHVRLSTWNLAQMTMPLSSFHSVNMTGDGTFSNLQFGLEAVAQRDFGDLGGGFPTLALDNGPWHLAVYGFSIGNNVTGELDGKPDSGGSGDNYDDGVQLVNAIGSPTDGLGNPIELEVGTNIIQIELTGSGGWLNAWMDFNGNQAFDTGEQIFTNHALTAGVHMLAFQAPSLPASGGAVAARFRWGEANLSYTGGSNSAGEVEDYMFGNSLTPAQIIDGDFDGNYVVDNNDYDLWKSTFGSTSDLRADGNGDGVVDAADMTIWADNRQVGTASSSSSRSSVAARSLAAPHNGAPNNHAQPHTTAPFTDLASYIAGLGYTTRTISVGLNGTQTIYVAPSTSRTSSIAQQDTSTTGHGPVIENVFGDDLQFVIRFAEPVTTVQRESFASAESVDEVTERAIFEDLLLAESHPRDTDPDDDLQRNRVVVDDHDEDESITAALALVLRETLDWRLL